MKHGTEACIGGIQLGTEALIGSIQRGTEALSGRIRMFLHGQLFRRLRLMFLTSGVTTVEALYQHQ